MSDPNLVHNAAEGIRPATAGWTYLSFRTVQRKADEELTGETGNEETALIWLGGTADVEGFGTVGEREDVFGGKPSTLLLPPGQRYRVRARTPSKKSRRPGVLRYGISTSIAPMRARFTVKIRR